MTDTLKGAFGLCLGVIQRIAFIAFAIAALALVAYSAACALGYAQWLSLEMRFGETVVPDAGVYMQLAVAALAVMLCAFLPSNARIMALETSHRNFHIGMRDVTMAYRAAHRADREGVFTLASEFDSIRERIAFLREHPDLTELEAPVLEVASQMSHVSRELARNYSDAKVARARDFLIQRQQEVETFNHELDKAKVIAVEMRTWMDRIEIEEDVARAQLARLVEELDQVMPALESEAARPPEAPKDSANVHPILPKAAE